MTKPKRFTLTELNEMPTLHQGHFANLKFEEGNCQVWLARTTVADGEPYDNRVTVEFLNEDGWVTLDEYQAL